MSDFIIHTGLGSPYARAVLATLIEKGVPYRMAAMAVGTQNEQPHLSRHPFGKIPALEHGDFMVYETQAILRYIDRVVPEPAMTPVDARAAARMDQLLGINDHYLFTGVIRVIGFHRIVSPMLLGTTPDEAAIAEAMPRAHTVFNELGRLLGRQDFLAGERLTLADLMIAPQLDMLSHTPEWSLLTERHSNLVAWLARMNARPSMATTALEVLAAAATPQTV